MRLGNLLNVISREDYTFKANNEMKFSTINNFRVRDTSEARLMKLHSKLKDVRYLSVHEKEDELEDLYFLVSNLATYLHGRNVELEKVEKEIRGLRVLILEDEEEYFNSTDKILNAFTEKLNKRNYITSISRKMNFVEVDAPYKVKILLSKNKAKYININTSIFLNEKVLSLSLSSENYEMNNSVESTNFKRVIGMLLLNIKNYLNGINDFFSVLKVIDEKLMIHEVIDGKTIFTSKGMNRDFLFSIPFTEEEWEEMGKGFMCALSLRRLEPLRTVLSEDVTFLEEVVKILT